MRFCAPLLVFACTTAHLGCDVWAAYDIHRPPESARVWLDDTPFIHPEQVCVDPRGLDLPADTELIDGELCVWDYFSGAVPEGLSFSEVSSCTAPWTQGPPWFAQPQRVFESPASLRDDEGWVAEADWARDQIRASGCSCCHAASSGSGNTTGFDVDAPGVWTDTMTNSQLSMSAGMNPLHAMFGEFAPEVNHGFSRALTLWPTTDPERMRAFFTAEFQRRDGGAADLAESQAAFDALFGGVLAPRSPCVTEFEGVGADGTIFWSGEGEARQIWVMEEGTASPAFPPNLDRPEGTLWAVYVNGSGAPIASGALRFGEVPSDAVQRVPEEGAPTLTPGVTYSIFASEDIMVGRLLNCTFTFSGSASDG